MYIFHNIEKLILLNNLQLLKLLVDGKHYYATSNLILDYYSPDIQKRVYKIQEKKHVEILEHDLDDLNTFINVNRVKYGTHINCAVLMQLHLCISNELTLIIDDADYTSIIKEIVNTYCITVSTIDDFFKTFITDKRYYDLLIEIETK